MKLALQISHRSDTHTSSIRYNMDTVRHFSLLLVLWLPGAARGKGAEDVTQTPFIWEDQGNEATMTCNQTKGSDYDQMYWFRQLPGEAMKMIVFTTTFKPDHDFGDFDSKKFSATKTKAESGTLTVKRLQPEDQGVYFCAVREHSDTQTRGRPTKTSPVKWRPAGGPPGPPVH